MPCPIRVPNFYRIPVGILNVLFRSPYVYSKYIVISFYIVHVVCYYSTILVSLTCRQRERSR
ncbi:hypothetical protein MBAV_003691 [Candidatus Magnetobacterium bavaricum]|uniref:Uncharacterized protein n=1 Tax=Candidatus Magnetobacterium bavaricum TaxID=29290 RepID=A0A0F3GQD9_9BACT|nr:hypothetical protein MBAV_003691 [Candidatus Magnetobacterium bavaricum]